MWKRIWNKAEKEQALEAWQVPWRWWTKDFSLLPLEGGGAKRRRLAPQYVSLKARMGDWWVKCQLMASPPSILCGAFIFYAPDHSRWTFWTHRTCWTFFARNQRAARPVENRLKLTQFSGRCRESTCDFPLPSVSCLVPYVELSPLHITPFSPLSFFLKSTIPMSFWHRYGAF